MAARFFAAEPPLNWEIVVDATVREGHELTATVSEHALEQGADTADHIRQKRPRLTMEVRITDTPIDTDGLTQTDGIKRVTREVLRYQKIKLNKDGVAVGGDVVVVHGRVLDGELHRVQRVWEAFAERFNVAKLVSVETEIATYTNMALVGVRAPIEKAGSASFTIELQQVQFDSLAVVAALPPKPKKPNAKPKVDRGQKPAQNRPEEANESLWTQMLLLGRKQPPGMSRAVP